MKLKIIALMIGLALISGCANQQPVPRIPFPSAEYEALPTTGTGTIEGQAFLKTVGGDVKYGAGSEVYLVPITSYSEQWYDVSYRQQKPFAVSDPRQAKFVRMVRADGNGNFKFEEVPPGKYFIRADVFWKAPSPYGGLSQQGGSMANRIEVSNGKLTRVIITR
ncbi:hypothetical protein [Pseudomonas yamanorum]|uniref:hypothetical protein n=1 Tax=Pseudomonas TaxID=286 RepID=UPI0009BFA4F8|nr:hypothetical protein [Pseudomonas yamanorum]